MQIVFAIIAIFWWIAIWGLNDILVESWSKEQKFYLYVSIVVLVAIIVLIFPDIIKRL
jgi:hypothetical protein